MKLNWSFSLNYSSFLVVSYFFLYLNAIPSYVNLAVMFSIQKNNLPHPYLPYLHSIIMGINHLNDKHDGIYDNLLPDTQVRIIHRASNDQALRGAVNAGSILQVDSKGVVACLGPLSNRTLQGAAPIFQENGGIPVVGFRDRGPLLGLNEVYPNMLRLVPGIYQDGYAIASLISKYFKWNKVTLFYQSTESSRTSTQVFRFYSTLFNIEILSSHIIDGSDSDLTIPIHLAKNAGSRIFILFVDPYLGKNLIEQGTYQKLFNLNTQIIGGEELSNSIIWKSFNLTKYELNTLLSGYIGVKYHAKSPKSILKDQFISRWINQKPTNGYVDSKGISHCNTKMDYYNTSYLYQFNYNLDPTQPIKCSGINYTSYKFHSNLQNELDDMMNGYDAVFAIARGLHQLYYNQKITNPSPATLRLSILNLSFIGVTGNVSFSKVMQDELLDIGGRFTELNYDILNYIPYDLTNTNTNDNDGDSDNNNNQQQKQQEQQNQQYEHLNVTFETIISWHSEKGFPKCQNDSYYMNNNPCYQFIFRTNDNTLPLDSPSPIIEEMQSSERIVLYFFSIFGIIYTISVLIINYQYRLRRLVKVNQPTLSFIKRIGILLGFIRVLFDSFDINITNCYTKLWLEHIAFQLIFSILWVKSWRVYLVTCKLKRVKITETFCFSLVLPSILIILTLLSTITKLNQLNISYITIRKNQFQYIQQPNCAYNSTKLINTIYGIDLIILSLCGIFCWLIRNVKSTVSNTSILVEGLITTMIVVIILPIILSLNDMNPNTRTFFIALVIALVLIRLLWIFDTHLIYHLFSGYELDHTLGLHKTEKNIFQLLDCFHLRRKIFSSIHDDLHATYYKTDEDYSDKNKKSKFSYLKTPEDVAHEIDRVREELKVKQSELSSLENMMFLFIQELSSTGRIANQPQDQDQEQQQQDQVQENKPEQYHEFYNKYNDDNDDFENSKSPRYNIEQQKQKQQIEEIKYRMEENEKVKNEKLHFEFKNTESNSYNRHA